MRLPKLKVGKSTRELESDNSSCVTCFVQNPSVLMLWTYVTNTCKSRYIFSNFLQDLCFLSFFFSFLFRHFTIVDEPILNLNFYNYFTIRRYQVSLLVYGPDRPYFKQMKKIRRNKT